MFSRLLGAGFQPQESPGRSAGSAEQRGEQAFQFVAFGRSQRGDEGLLGDLDPPLEFGERRPALIRHGDDVPAPVLRVLCPLGPGAGDQFVDQAHQIALVDTDPLTRRSLALWPELVEGREQRVVTSMRAVRRQLGGNQGLPAQCRLSQEPGRQGA